MSTFLAVVLSVLAFWPQSTEDSKALDLDIDLAAGATFRFDDTYPALTAEVRYDITESSAVVGTLYMPFNDDGITWTNETFKSRSGTGVSASGGDLTGAGFQLAFNSPLPYGETGTMTLIYEDASDVVLQTTTIDFTITQPEITSVLVNGGSFTEGQAFAIEQGGELTVTVEGTSHYSGEGVVVGNQDDFDLSTMDVVFDSGVSGGENELGPLMFVFDPAASPTFGPFTVRLTNTGDIDPGTYQINIQRSDDDGFVPGTTFFNLTINEPATFCGDFDVDEPNDDGGYEQCDNGGLCEDDSTFCNSLSDCIGIGSGACIAQPGDGCDGSCQSEYYTNVSLSAQYCPPSGGTIDLSYDVSLPAEADVLSLSIRDDSGFGALSDELAFTAVGVNNTGTFTPAFPSFLSLPSDAGTFDATGVTSVQLTVTCDTISGPWYINIGAIDNDLGQSINPGMRTRPFEVTNSSPVCGDGSVDIGEDCDDSGESASCDADCSNAICGDGTLNASAGEQCDDGNTDNGDGCDSSCQNEASAATGGSAGTRGRIGDRNTFGDEEEEELSEDGVPELVLIGEERSQDEPLRGSAEDWTASFVSLDLSGGYEGSFSPSIDASNWIETTLLLGYVPDSESEYSEYYTPRFDGFQAEVGYGSADEIDESSDEPIEFPFGIGYPSFRDQLRLQAQGSLDVFDEQAFSYEMFDSVMTAHESVELSATLPFELVAQLYKENALLVGSLQMLEVRPESAEGWEGLVIGDQMERVEDFRLSLEATYADTYEDEVFISPIPNAVDCPSCAVHFSLAVTMYRQYLLPLEVLYSDLLCDASMSEGDKNTALRIVIDNIDQAQRILEHYLENYAECRAAVDEEVCPEEIDLEALAPETMDEACVEEPVYEVKEFSAGILGELDENLSKRFREYRRANNRTSYDLTKSLNF